MKLIRSSQPARSTPAIGDTSTFLQRKYQEALPRKAHPFPPPFNSLEPAVAEYVLSRWSRLCEEMFEYLATEHPKQLLTLMLMHVPAADLTFAAEIAGRLIRAELVTPVLFGLLNHPDPVVREGAIYGLEEHRTDAVLERIARVAERDLSPAVRSAASDVLTCSNR